MLLRLPFTAFRADDAGRVFPSGKPLARAVDDRIMTSDLLLLLGGIGLFLFGMQTMTDALRQLASEQARSVLAGFTRTPLSGAITGALTTATVQSSTATMVTTVGFVGAGLLGFQQALGIIFGASIGTTITGWMVLFLGIRLPLAAAALPVLFAAALLRVLSTGQIARMAMAVAGLCLVFLGIDMMQDGLAAYEDHLTPDRFPAPSLAGRLQLVALGLVVTLVTQSSSAGVAATLVLLSTGAVSFEQAAALVIGMHVGTTFTPLLAAIGGSVGVRRTAVANILFHAASGLLALAFIDVVSAILGPEPARAAAQLGLVCFHTGFNVIGTAVMLPLTAPFAALITRLVREDAGPAAAGLDRQLLAEPAAALDALSNTAERTTAELFGGIARALTPGQSPAHLAELHARGSETIAAMHDYQARITVADDRADDLARSEALLHLQDHLGRLIYRMGQQNRLSSALADPLLRRYAQYLGILMARHVAGADVHARLERLNRRLAAREHRLRREIMRSGLPPARLFALTDSLRWIRRTSAHAERIVHHARAARPRPAPAPQREDTAAANAGAQAEDRADTR